MSMYWYALIGLLATAELIIVNYDILSRSGDSQKFPDIGIYRKFLYGIMSYYITDILWGFLDSLHLTALLFVDTVVYYVAMAVGVLFWTQYVVTYLAEDNAFSRFLYHAGRLFFAVVVAVTVINCFTPVLFWFDENGAYHACPARHAQLVAQILLLMLTSAYTFRAMLRTEGAVKKRYRTICLFGLVVAVLLLVQLQYPFLPLYTIGYMLGSGLLHTFVVGDEMEEYREAINIMLKRQSELSLAASKAKSAFLSNMSHEIRTPINAVLGMNEMILRESGDRQSIVEYSENIRTAGNRLLGIVNDIIDFSKIDTGRMEINSADYDLSSLIKDLVTMIQAKADEKGLLLKLDFDESMPKLLNGDEARVKQVITNILSNSVKYTKEGSVAFRIGYERIPDAPDGVYLDFSVSDTGIGIKPEDMEKLFTEFERIEEKRNRNIAGTGLGLNITKRLLEMMKSELKVESVYGEGSTFSFRLRQKVVKWEPLGNYEAAGRPTLPEQKKFVEKFTSPDAAVLAVDDTPMNLTVFRGLLKSTKIHIDTADSGGEGLELMRKKKYDLIVLDHMMPEMDGIETLHKLRAEAGNPNLNTPVICLTANAIPGAREMYLAEGFTDYLSKPVEGAVLEAGLIKYLPPEKIVYQEEPEDEEDALEETTELGTFYAGVPELNYEDAVRFCANEELLKQTLDQFYRSIKPNADAIEGFLRSKDYKNYTIKVHALKSSARLIGAQSLSADARHLEDWGNSLTDDDIKRIEDLTPKLLADYRGFIEILSPLYAAEEAARESAPEISVEELKEAYDAIEQFVESFDIDAIDGFISEIRKYRIPKPEEEKFAAIEECVRNMDWIALEEALKG